MVMVLSFVVAAAVCIAPAPVAAEPSAEKQKSGKSEKKNAKDRAKRKGQPAEGVNRMYDGFKKGSGAAKDDAGKVRKSVNDAYDRTK